MNKYMNKFMSGNDPRINVTEEFIKRNKLNLSRTPEEIMSRLRKARVDLFNMETEVLPMFLSYEDAKEFLNTKGKQVLDKNPEKWIQITDIHEAAQDFLDYMVFAWMKATDQRGLAASRSIQKLGAWLWLMGRTDLCNLISNNNLYAPYGTPALIAVCEKLGIEVPEYVRKFANG